MFEHFDEKEYNNICAKYYDMVYKYCFFRLRDNDYSMEAANDVMVELYKKWIWIDKGDKIPNWLMKTAENMVKRIQRELAKPDNNAISIEEAEENGTLHLVDDTDLMLEILNKDFDLEAELNKIADKLPEEYRKFFIMHYIQKIGINDIVKILNLNYGKVRIRINKAKMLALHIIKNDYN
ncbi:MAG: sigma-70 family RNA polymerase sigma factor [Clostridia bacterium]|nr:sigma-70 family RNA polymerase sigma factor [Clostridia bacterium]